MVSNPYNLNLKVGYEEVVQLVQQLSSSDKAKLIEEVYADVPQNKSSLNYLKKMASRVGKRTKSVGSIVEERKGAFLSATQLNTVSVGESTDVDYSIDKEAVVGKWPGNESVDELLNMLSK